MSELRQSHKVQVDQTKKRRKMHNDLCNLMDKYKEMTKRIGTLSSVYHLLNNIDLPIVGK